MNRWRAVWRMLLALCLALALLPVGAAAGQSEPPEGDPAVNEGVGEGEPAEFEVTLPPEGVTVLPMANRVNAEAVPYPDPGAYFKIGSTSYAFTTADCDPDTAGDQGCSNPIQAGINYLSSRNAAPAGGNIFIGAGTYMLTAPGTTPATHITLDSANWATPPAVINLVGMGSLNDGSAVTDLYSNITIVGMGSWGLRDLRLVQILGTTVSAVNCIGSVSISRVQFLGGRGLEVDKQTGPVTITETNVRGSNRDGANLNVTGKVVISNSSFHRNAGDGLRIDTSESVLLNGVSASENIGTGASVQTDTIKATVNAAASTFSNNSGGGLAMSVVGSVWLDKITSTRNGGAGLAVLNLDPATKASFTLLRSMVAGNSDGGVVLDSASAITLDGVMVESNGGSYGVLITNSGAFKPVVIRDRLGPMVIQRNDGTGLYIQRVGAVTLSGLSANNNLKAGVQVENLDSKQSVNLSRVKVTGNGMSGGAVNTNGGVVMTDSQVDDNTVAGFYIQQFTPTAAKPVTVLRSTFNHNRGGDGLSLAGRGRITLKSIQASGNGFRGLTFNLRGPEEGKTPLLMDSVTANSNTDQGVQIITSSNVTLSKITASGNSEHGLLLDAAAIAVSPTVILKGRRGQNQFADNVVGVNIRATGKVMVSGVQASGNGQLGLHIENNHGDLGVSLTEISAVGNGLTAPAPGIWVETGASVTGRKLTAGSNSNAGIVVTNTSFHRLDRPVVLQDVQATNNIGDGVYIFSDSPVTLSAVQASANTENGLSLRSTNNTIAAPIQITNKGGSNRFVGNGQRGIFLQAGPAVLNYIFVADNGWGGENFGMSYAINNQPLTVNCGVFSGNSDNALYFASTVDIPLTLNNVLFQNNALDGSVLDTYWTPAGVNVTWKPGACSGW